MKKSLKQMLIAFTVICTCQYSLGQYPVPSTLFGINGWMSEKIGDATNVYGCYGMGLSPQQPCFLYGKFDNTIMSTCTTKVKELNVNLIRFGGHANDINPATYDQVVNYIEKCRSIGADMILEIPYGEGHYTATYAYDLIYYLNTTRGMKIKYVAIGNEPDKYAAYAANVNDQQKANYIANYFRPIADTIKAFDSNIKIIGLSFSEYSPGVYDLLLDSSITSSQLVKKNSSGRYRLDIVDIHRYPFKADANHTIDNIIKDPQDTTYSGNFASVLKGSATSLLTYISDANNSRSPGAKLQFSISEMNICYKNPASNSYSGLGANGFTAGQWMAEMYAVAMNKAYTKSVDLAFISPWGVHEHSGDSSEADLGF